jgi:hypothetical protein
MLDGLGQAAVAAQTFNGELSNSDKTCGFLTRQIMSEQLALF